MDVSADFTHLKHTFGIAKMSFTLHKKKKNEEQMILAIRGRNSKK